MKNILFLILCMAFMHTGKTQQVDSVVARVTEANLKVVSDYIDGKEKTLQKISAAVTFFTDLTGIQSEAHGTYYGQFRPTANDLVAWSRWYDVNKEFLVWDRELRSVILYKKIKPELPGL